MNWNEYKFHCSALGNLLTPGKKKCELMGATCKSELNKIWAKHTYNFYEIIETSPMTKGNENEQIAIDMLERKHYPNKPLFKNQQLYENEFICGTPDVVVPVSKTVHDIKNSWNLRTFINAELSKGYKYQLMGYAWMIGYDKCQLDYCLTSASPEMIAKETLRMAYKLDAIDYQDTEEFKKIEEQIRLNMNYDRIEEIKRVKSFAFELEDSFIKLIEERAPIWRQYLENLKL